MIIYLYVYDEGADYVKQREGKDFGICWTHYKDNGYRLFEIDTTEEELVFLKLKYGKENAWKRS